MFVDNWFVDSYADASSRLSRARENTERLRHVYSSRAAARKSLVRSRHTSLDSVWRLFAAGQCLPWEGEEAVFDTNTGVPCTQFPLCISCHSVWSKRESQLAWAGHQSAKSELLLWSGKVGLVVCGRHDEAETTACP
jgi:hypothetical protein